MTSLECNQPLYYTGTVRRSLALFTTISESSFQKRGPYLQATERFLVVQSLAGIDFQERVEELQHRVQFLWILPVLIGSPDWNCRQALLVWMYRWQACWPCWRWKSLTSTLSAPKEIIFGLSCVDMMNQLVRLWRRWSDLMICAKEQLRLTTYLIWIEKKEGGEVQRDYSDSRCCFGILFLCEIP